MDTLIIKLMEEYQRLLEAKKEHDAWRERFNDSEHWNSWHYQSTTGDKEPQSVPKNRIKRTGILLRQIMTDYEK